VAVPNRKFETSVNVISVRCNKTGFGCKVVLSS